MNLWMNGKLPEIYWWNYEWKEYYPRFINEFMNERKKPRHNLMEIGFQRNCLDSAYVVALGILKKSLHGHNPP